MQVPHPQTWLAMAVAPPFGITGHPRSICNGCCQTMQWATNEVPSDIG